MVRNLNAPKTSQILSHLESLHQRTGTQNKLDPAKRFNITNRTSRPTDNSAASSKRDLPESSVANFKPRPITKLTPKSPLSTNPDSDDAELDPSFFLRPMATKRALSSEGDDTKPRKKTKFGEPLGVECKHLSSPVKKSMPKGPLTRTGVRSNGPEAARTASTLKSSPSSEKLFFSDSNDQELVELGGSPGFQPKEILRDYQEDHPFEFNAHLFEAASADPAPEVETATVYSKGPSNSRPPAKKDAKDEDDGVHDWYKAVAGDEATFDKLFSSIVFVDEPFE